LDRAVGAQLAVATVAAAALAALAFRRARGARKGQLRWLLLAAAALLPHALLVALPRVVGRGSPALADVTLVFLALVPAALASAFAGARLDLRELVKSGAATAGAVLAIG